MNMHVKAGLLSFALMIVIGFFGNSSFADFLSGLFCGLGLCLLLFGIITGKKKL
ncbi:MAG: hypothetical protein FWE91_08590 [Defluviitaleaceae bacterium]|nr:hypothetical protein [Defluviitaleaceae bacterium]MCL2835254.1 hypothetical protein [Defluviitaleaceae bacterium]